MVIIVLQLMDLVRRLNSFSNGHMAGNEDGPFGEATPRSLE